MYQKSLCLLTDIGSTLLNCKLGGQSSSMNGIKWVLLNDLFLVQKPKIENWTCHLITGPRQIRTISVNGSSNNSTTSDLNSDPFLPNNEALVQIRHSPKPTLVVVFKQVCCISLLSLMSYVNSINSSWTVTFFETWDNTLPIGDILNEWRFSFHRFEFVFSCRSGRMPSVCSLCFWWP